MGPNKTVKVAKKVVSGLAQWKRPVFDYKYLVANESLFVDSIKRREMVGPVLDNYYKIKPLYEDFVQLDKTVRDMKHQRGLEQDRFMESKDKSILDKLKTTKTVLSEKESKLQIIKDQLEEAAESIPNLIHDSVTDKEVIVDTINAAEVQEVENPALDHKSICEKLGVVDFVNASRVSGPSWYYLLGDAALLEQALVQYALKLARQLGFKMCIPPSIVKNVVSNSCGFKPRDQSDETQVYQLKNNDLCLTGTAEIPLAGLRANSVLENLHVNPEKLVGVSRSYRAEAGALGKDTKGLYRVHEFTKVELFVFSKNDMALSNEELLKLVEFQKKFVKSLGLTAKVMNMPANDLGAPAYQKFDIEAFMPGRGSWGELSSSSNCLDFQSRRLNIKYKELDGTLKYVHTLNGTAVAVPRVILAIIENNYDPDTETIEIPHVLRPYMDDKERISKQ